MLNKKIHFFLSEVKSDKTFLVLDYLELLKLFLFVKCQDNVRIYL